MLTILHFSKEKRKRFIKLQYLLQHRIQKIPASVSVQCTVYMQAWRLRMAQWQHSLVEVPSTVVKFTYRIPLLESCTLKSSEDLLTTYR